MTTTTLDGLAKAEVIARIVANDIATKTWRSVTERAALAYLSKSEKARKADVVAFVKAEFDAADAGFLGRWQSYSPNWATRRQVKRKAT